jgi:hypothetical protein
MSKDQRGGALVPFGRTDLNTGTRSQPAAGKGMSVLLVHISAQEQPLKAVLWQWHQFNALAFQGSLIWRHVSQSCWLKPQGEILYGSGSDKHSLYLKFCVNINRIISQLNWTVAWLIIIFQFILPSFLSILNSLLCSIFISSFLRFVPFVSFLFIFFLSVYVCFFNSFFFPSSFYLAVLSFVHGLKFMKMLYPHPTFKTQICPQYTTQ